ncbi:HAD family hydrolase [Pacificoceanicola onchidii]|uniref:HAD family hydrolase n=1 Tax=Pacificoceanicola onchidii TaxID=2562685 RepID=UPI0010A5E592|nr:HAD-IA family hydrolase [Pacificoceanicola onchidii]
MTVLFDLDGTLLDTKPAVIGAYCRAIEAIEGHVINPDGEHQQELMRRRPAEYFAQHYPTRADMLTNAYQAGYRSDLAQPYSHVEALLTELSQFCAIGIVSNKGRSRILGDLAHCGIDSTLFSVIIGADDTPERKPHPAPLLKGLLECGAAAGQAAYVGDGPHDVVAAKAAGMRAVAVSWGYYSVAQLRAEGPDHITQTVPDLRALFF